MRTKAAPSRPTLPSWGEQPADGNPRPSAVFPPKHLRLAAAAKRVATASSNESTQPGEPLVAAQSGSAQDAARRGAQRAEASGRHSARRRQLRLRPWGALTMPKTSPIRPASWAAHEAYWLRLAAPTCCPGHPLAPFWPNRALAPGGFDTGAVSARSRAGPRQLRRVRRGRRRPHIAPGLRHRHVQARPELDGAQPAGAARRDVRPRPPRNPFLTCSPYPPRVCRPRTGRHTHTTRASPCRYAAVDLDGDGRVDFADFAVTRRTHTQTHTHTHTHTHTPPTPTHPP